MREKNQFLLTFLLIIIISLSGCINQGSRGTGLVIEEFIADEPPIYSGNEVLFRLKVRNTGSTLAKIHEVKLYGADWLTKEETGEPNCNEELKGNVYPSDETGYSGGTKTCEFRRTAPDIQTGLVQEYLAKAKVVYSYKDSAMTSIMVTTAEEARRIKDRGGTFPTREHNSIAGPLDIQIMIKDMLYVAVGSQPTVTIPIEIKIRNVGDGIVCKEKEGECNPESMNLLELEIDTGEDTEGNNKMTLEGCENKMDVELYKGYENSVTCKLVVSNFPDVGVQERLLRVSSEHGYLIEKELPIKVIGRF